MEEANLFNFMTMLVNMFESGISVVGAALTLIGIVALGMGCMDIYNHFKPENRDNPGEKNRFVSGAVKFAVGGLLATSGYQVLATNTFQDGAVEDTGAISIEIEAEIIAATSIDLQTPIITA